MIKLDNGRRRIKKYLLDRRDACEVQMPETATPISVRFVIDQTGSMDLWLWAIVDDSGPNVTRRFTVAGTGQELSSGELSPRKYIGTAVEPTDLPYAWHIFEAQ